MALLEFINQHVDWQELLQIEPYNLNIVSDYPYTMIKYKKEQMDFSNPIVREARGCIIYYNGVQWIYACRSFDKFCNYGEEYSAVNNIDWDYVSVREKVDGSLIKIWFSPHRNLWQVSTNGAINADKVYVGDTNITYYEYFINALGGRENFQKLLDQLEVGFTYMFELVGPENRIVVEYDEPAVYFLRYRENICGKLGFTTFDISTIKYPKMYYLRTLNECIEAAAAMSKNEEGFVVSDAQDNMIKVKSPEYLIAARAHNNGILTIKRALEIIEEGKVDDFLAYAPIFGKKMLKITSLLNGIVKTLEEYGKIERNEDRKKHYQTLNSYSSLETKDDIRKMVIAFGMAYYDGKVDNAYDFLMTTGRRKLINILELLVNSDPLGDLFNEKNKD